MGGSLCICDAGSRFVGGLPLAIAAHPGLQTKVRADREKLRQRIIEVKSLAGMDFGPSLDSVEFVHLEGG